MRRAPTSNGRLFARPQMAEKIMNSRMEVTKVRTSPKRRAIHPLSGCMTAAGSLKELRAQVPSEVVTPRLPEIDGTETLTMVMSRISMNEAVAMATVRKNSLPPCKGGYSPGMAGCAESAIGDPIAGDPCPDFGARPHRLRHWPCPDPVCTPVYRRPAPRLPRAPAPVRREMSCPP